MRVHFLFIFLLSIANSVVAQDLVSYQKPIERTFFSEALGDSVSIEIILPKDLKSQWKTIYPVIYLLDKQLRNNYKYNLHTIDYLSTLQAMPESIVIGIPFSRSNRDAWTMPNASGGKADDLISFLVDELNAELKANYPISEFNLLIGHSRTAIFSSYALSKRFDFFNAAIASSVADFDFGDSYQKAQFETFLDAIDTSSHKYYYYFSVGEEAYGDLHESAVDTLNAFLNSIELPTTLEWKYYKHKAAHDLTPGLTVSKSLSEIFKEYGRRVDLCFDLAKNSPHKVPWDDYLAVYESMSSDLGFTIQPDELFYNSIASTYYNDYNGDYGENKLRFTLEILLKAIEANPSEYGYYTWVGEIYVTLKDNEKGVYYLERSIELIRKDESLSKADSEYLLNEARDLLKLAE